MAWFELSPIVKSVAVASLYQAFLGRVAFLSDFKHFTLTYLATTSKCHQESIACFVALCIPNWSSRLVRPLFVAGVHTAGKLSRPTSCVDQESCILGRTMHPTAVDIRWGNRSWLPWQLLVAHCSTAECKLLTWQWVISFVVANLSEVSYPTIHCLSLSTLVRLESWWASSQA